MQGVPFAFIDRHRVPSKRLAEEESIPQEKAEACEDPAVGHGCV
jgi:hypothetical protein